MMLAVASQPQVGNSTFATGGDVSRFQRSTVPAKASGSALSGGVNTAGVPMPGGVPGAANAAAAGGAAAGVPMGPVVRVARGNSVTVVPVGGNK